MVDYYKDLQVSADATNAEIKSAYRRLARKIHPDINTENENSTREFAKVSKAYKVLSNPQDRSYYDRRKLKAKFARNDSLFDLENTHASRAKQMMYEKRYNDIIDRMIAEERQESMALQQIIFPIVSLFITTSFVAIFKPLFWSNSSLPGKIIMLTLFIVGVLHLLKRLHAGFERYTYSSLNIHDSLFNEIDEDTRPYSRIQAMSFLIAGITLSLIIGLVISSFIGMINASLMPQLFSESFHFEFLFYPPIVVLFVDLMHTVATRIEQTT